jgi:hypothetical protein
MEFTLSIGFNPETLKRIDAFLQAINSNAPAAKVKAEPVKQALEKSIAEGPAKAASTNGKAVVITLEDLRKLAADKTTSSKANKAKFASMLQEYGVASLSKVPEDKHVELFNQLTEM